MKASSEERLFSACYIRHKLSSRVNFIARILAENFILPEILRIKPCIKVIFCWPSPKGVNKCCILWKIKSLIQMRRKSSSKPVMWRIYCCDVVLCLDSGVSVGANKLSFKNMSAQLETDTLIDQKSNRSYLESNTS